MEQSEVIVKVGAEGGSITLFGVRTKEGWQFSRELIDQSLLLLDEPEIRHDSKVVSSWPEALELMDRYPWQHLRPLDVHPEFRGMVFEAVLERYNAKSDKNPRRLPDWEKVCSIVGGEPTFATSDDIEDKSSDAYIYD